MKVLAVALAALLPIAVATPAFAKGDPKKAAAAKKAADNDDDDDDDDKAPAKKAAPAKKSSDDDDDDDKKKPAPPPPADEKKASKAAVPPSKDDDDDDDDDKGGGFSNGKKIKVKDTGEAPMVKQDLNGHDMGSTKKTTEFEKDRFFVDKSDTEKTADKTLVQGSLTSSSFLFKEFGGGAFAGSTAGFATNNSNASSIGRYFTDLRLQTDFRHIGGGRWDARVDFRVRVIDPTDPVDEKNTQVMGTANAAGSPPTPAVQGSALDGGNEYDLRELWLVRKR